ncbi:MAG: hypothetical protein PHC34_13145 [Candidatus Gastranaerophilales bacterium]|nr:hypothetical protein [Candidatus Gastranaerophilales bacterium]
MTRRHLLIIPVLLSILLNINFSAISFAQNTIIAQPINQEIPKNIPILAISRTNLATATAKPGDIFTAKIVEDMKICDKLLIPANSIVCGMVTEVKKPKRYPLRNGAITLYVNLIETPQGQKISLEGREVLGKIISPLEKSIDRRFYEAAPIRAGGYGTTIPLSKASDLSSGAVYVIGMGASMVVGAVTGFVVPDVGRTRLRSSLERTVDSTPIGSIRGFVAVGQEVGIKCGDGIILNFDKKTIEKLESQLIAQSCEQKQGVASK